MAGADQEPETTLDPRGEPRAPGPRDEPVNSAPPEVRPLGAPERATEPKPTDEQAFDELRRLLVGPEREDLDDLRDTVAGKTLEPEEVGRLLPAAVRARGDEDRELTAALTPSVESAIETSVKRNPGVLVDAIFPVIGPAIRRSIKESLTELTERINETLEHGLSPRGISWRLQAWRTGVPFGEIVLKNSLVFRIEQAFLIHRETGLLLAHATDPTAGGNDPDTVSAMLSAIEGFVSDSFEGEGGIDQVEFGAQVLEVAHGPTAVLACVVRGSLPPAQRRRLTETLEAIHARKADALRAFDGDGRDFADTQLQLEDLLVEERPTKDGVRWQRLVFWPALVVGLSFLIGHWILDSRDEAARWRAAREALAETPGILPLIEQRTDDGYLVGGLRDPLAADPVDVLVRAGLDRERLDGRWGLYQSEDPAIVVLRARLELEPPAGVTMDFAGGRLSFTGEASHAWLTGAREALAAERLPGVLYLDLDAVTDLDLDRAVDLAGGLSEGLELDFALGDARLSSVATEELLTERWSALAAHCDSKGIPLAVELTFEESATGDPLLTWQRRDHLVRLLSDAAPGAPAPDVLGELLLDRPGGDRALLTLHLGSPTP